LSSLKARVYGISVDSPFVLNAFIKAHDLKFQALDGLQQRDQPSIRGAPRGLDGLKGVSKRSVFVIDKQGVVRYKWVSEDPRQLPDLAAIRGALEGLA
jgi:peroxiredoxin